MLLDVVIDDPEHREASLNLLVEAARSGALIISPAAFAEVAVNFTDRDRLESLLAARSIRTIEHDGDVAWTAGRYFRAYIEHRARSGTPRRTKIAPDLLIAAHARVHADHLLTRDRDFQKPFFDELAVVTTADV